MGQFDQTARYGAKLDPPGFINWLIRGLELTHVFSGWLDTRTLPFPGEPDRICETVAEFADRNDPTYHAALVIEFMVEPERLMMVRLLEYKARVLREMRSGPHHYYQVACALLNLTGPAQSSVLESGLRGVAEAGLRMQVVLRTLRDEDAAATLQGIGAGNIARCILVWIPLMRNGGESSNIQEWMRLAELEPNSRMRNEYAGLALVFAELGGCLSQWKQALEGWNMRESVVISGWKAEGKAEGKAETKRDDLVEVLRARFALELPDELLSTIEATSDLEALAQWFHAALTASSLDEFWAAMTKPGRNGTPPSA